MKRIIDRNSQGASTKLVRIPPCRHIQSVPIRSISYIIFDNQSVESVESVVK